MIEKKLQKSNHGHGSSKEGSFEVSDTYEEKDEIFVCVGISKSLNDIVGKRKKTFSTVVGEDTAEYLPQVESSRKFWSIQVEEGFSVGHVKDASNNSLIPFKEKTFDGVRHWSYKPNFTKHSKEGLLVIIKISNG